MSRQPDDAAADAVTTLRREMERERAKLRALQEIGMLLGTTLDLNELLSLVLEKVSAVMDCDRSTLYLLDDESGELWSKVAQGEASHEIRLKLGEGLAGSVAKSGKPLNLKDAYQDVRFDAEWDRRTGYRTRSVLCVPLRNQHQRTIGVIQCLNKRRGGWFSVDDEALLGALGAQAAVSIENSKLFLSVVGKNIELLETQEQLQRKIRELDVLFEIAQVSASALELDEMLQGLLARTMRAVDAEAASILMADDVTGDLHFRAAMGGEPQKVSKLRIKAGRGISGWVAKNGAPQVVNHVDQDLRHSRHIADEVGYHPRNVLCVPLRWSEGDRQGIGAVELLNKQRGQSDFTSDDVKLATVIAGHISTAIEQARSRERREREERLSALGQFLASVLHDLKAPMTVIKGYSRMLESEGDAAVRKEYVDSILAQVDILDAMTRETLAFARGDRKLWVRKVYLHDFFEKLGEQLRRALGDRVTIELDLRDRGVAHFDAPKIQRAIHNLARNAAEAIAGREGDGQGGRGTFRLVVDRDASGAIVLQCVDDGPGVPEEIRERIFESFTTHGKQGGTGLGLAIVRQIVEDHGGEIEVESVPGQTVFSLSLPQPADRAASSSGEQPAA